MLLLDPAPFQDAFTSVIGHRPNKRGRALCDLVQAIEQRCNAVIREAHAVRQVLVDEGNREALAASPLLRGNLPPADRVKGAVRLIEIRGVDINACGGTHLQSTAELQVQSLAV